MKNNVTMKSLLFMMLLVIMVFFFSCDSFLVPMAARLNPDDDQNPVPPPSDFEIIINTDVREQYFPELTWTPSEADGYYIIRKARYEPKNIWDGEFVSLIENGEEAYAEDSYPDCGCRVYYAIFSYKAKWEDIKENDKISAEEGVLGNYRNYYFTGPVINSIIGYAARSYYPFDDGWIGASNPFDWYKSEDSLITEAVGVSPVAVSCMNFDISDYPPGEIVYAELILRRYSGNPWEGDIELDLLDISWDGQEFSTIIDSENIDDLYKKTISVSNSEEAHYFNIWDVYQAWRDEQKDNNGFRLITYTDYDGNTPFKIYSNDAAEKNAPELRIFYYEEQ